MTQPRRTKTKFTGVYRRESTTQRHDGKPDVCFEITYKVNGRKIWEKVGWRSEGYSAPVASRIRSERLRNSRHGDIQTVRDLKKELTLNEAWKEYDRLHLRGRKGRDRDANRYEKHLAPRFGHRRLSQITPLDLTQYRVELAATYRPQTVHHILALLRRIYRRTIKLGLWSGEVPTLKVDFPVVQNERKRWLRPDEAQRLLDEVERRSRTWYYICVLSLHTGMRAGEVFALTGDRIHLDAGTIDLLDTKYGQREVYINATIRAVLNQLDIHPGKLLFTKTRGKDKGNPLDAISDTVERSISAVGLNDGYTDRLYHVTFHSLRHTFASWLAQAGVPMRRLAELLGQTVERTTKRYSHLAPGQNYEAVGIVEEVFNGNQPQFIPYVGDVPQNRPAATPADTKPSAHPEKTPDHGQ